MVYPGTMSDRMEPLDGPEPTDLECWWRCPHGASCERAWVTAGGAEGREAMAEALRCRDCEYGE